MLDIKFVRENPEAVKENIRKKFQDAKLPLVDEVIALDKRNREIKQEVEDLRAKRNKTSKMIGALMAQGKRAEAEEVKAEIAKEGARIDALSAEEKQVEEDLLKKMMVIPNIIDPSVPVGKTTAKTSKSSVSVSRRCRISKSPTIRRSWRVSTASISTPRAASPAMASTI